MASSWGGSWGTSWAESWGAETSGEDNLSANSVESASQVSSPTLAQVHAFTATSVQSTSQVTSPTIGQKHALTSTSVQSTSQVSAPVLEALSEHVLTAASVQALSQLSSPALAQVHILTAPSIQSASQVTRPGLGVPAAEPVGGHYWPDERKRKKPKDYRAELDERRLRERAELRQLIERAAGLIDEALETEEPKAEAQATALNVELGKLREYAQELDRNPERELHAIQERVNGLIAKATEELIVQVANALTDLIQEMAEDLADELLQELTDVDA